MRGEGSDTQANVLPRRLGTTCSILLQVVPGLRGKTFLLEARQRGTQVDQFIKGAIEEQIAPQSARPAEEPVLAQSAHKHVAAIVRDDADKQVGKRLSNACPVQVGGIPVREGGIQRDAAQRIGLIW